MKSLFGAVFATMIGAVVLAPGAASAAPARGLPGGAWTPESAAPAEPVAYRRRAVAPRRAMAPRRYVVRRGYRYDPGPAAIFGAIAGIAGAGIAASQADRYDYPGYYGYPAFGGYGGYGYGYGYYPW